MRTYKYLSEKCENFVKFIRSNLLQVEKSKLANIEIHLKKLENCTIDMFVNFIALKLLPNKSNLESYV